MSWGLGATGGASVEATWGAIRGASRGASRPPGREATRPASGAAGAEAEELPCLLGWSGVAVTASVLSTR